MSTKRESKQAAPSVMARLMGLDEMRPQQPIQKKPRVLSENYLCKAASIGIREKCPERHSFNLNSEDQDGHNAVFLQTLRKKKQPNTPVQKRELHLDSSGVKMKVTEAHHVSWDKKLRSSKDSNEPLAAIDSEMINILKHLQRPDLRITKKVNQPNDVRSSLQSGCVRVLKSPSASYSRKISMCRKFRRKSERGHVNSLNIVQNGLGIGDVLIDDMNKFSRSKFKANNRSFLPTSTIVVPKPNLGKADSALRSFSHYVSYPGNGKQKDILSSCNGDLYSQVKRGKNLADGVGIVKPRSRFLRERTRKVGRNIGSMPFEESSSEISGSGLCAKESELTVLSTPILSDRKGQFFNSDGSNVVREAKKPISERWKMTKRNYDTLGISSDVSHEFIRDLPRSRSLLAYFNEVGSPNTRTSHEPLENSRRASDFESVNLIQNKLREQDFDQKDDSSEFRSSDSSYKKSQRFPCLEVENISPVGHNCVVQNEMECKLKEKDSGGQVSAVAKSSGQNNQTSQDIWMKQEGLKNEGWREDHPGHQFESRNSVLSIREEDSYCHIQDSSVQQEFSNDIFEEESVSSPISCTGPESVMSFEEAYQPSPNSVLEPFYGKEIFSSSDSFKGVNASLHGLHTQLELLQSETSEAYSEGSSMVVSSDEDNGEGSVNDSEENQGLMRLFRVEESRDFSYLVDVLAEAAFHNRNSHSQEFPISSSVFEILEKRYGEQISWKRSERRLLFDRINPGLMEILQLSMGVLTWKKSVARRFNFSRRPDMIEEELWMLLVNQEKEARKESEKFLGKHDGWMELGDDIQIIGREIENSLIDELVADVSMESF
ncbi:uncharacterized protein LOC110624847 [Manihot esculenta]|uniref:DUF4378 domain-containing protein n=1 Tax=Manihot esculenta TaxID=3983 RepID=A0A2C9V339_MANES|nr:uncharacterized protein LOC110624847 [Manihot esculenta]XP_043816946.1 uncharacterized protein LOC110624847 [Manihot esculenta]OAY38700.1 hypothetical protein MANES_10G036800v8 [Manihot esculenta]